MQDYIIRKTQAIIKEILQDFPVVALLGPRQCGKSTLARHILTPLTETVYLDLERPSDLRKLDDPELFLEHHTGDLVCLDEIQRKPDLFPVLRSIVDDRRRNGQFLILGSASRDLIKQSSESLAGRICFIELSPFTMLELLPNRDDVGYLSKTLWSRGGFPRSYLARNDAVSYRWRESFIRTYLERDIPQLGFNIPAITLRRLWTMLAHNHGQIFNASRIGEALGLSHTTVRKYLDLLSQTFMVRVLQPIRQNIGKRIIKSPKVYVRDSGILHALLDLETLDDLFGHPACGVSWEGFVIENILASFPGWNPYFYRTSYGTELDLVLEKGNKRIAVECKKSTAPRVHRGFWTSLNDLHIDEAWIIAPVKETYPVGDNVHVCSLHDFLTGHD